MIDTKTPDYVSLYLERGEEEDMPPMTAAEAVLHRPDGVADEDIALKATYADGSVVVQPYATDEGVLDLVADTDDTFTVIRRPRTVARDQGLDAVVEALRAWIDVQYPVVDADEQVMHDVMLDPEPSIRFSFGNTVFGLKLQDRTGALRAIWRGESLLGLSYSNDEALPPVDEAQVALINQRLKIISSRVAGEWEVVADECVRLGSKPHTGLKVGDPVKIGVRPVHPLPDDMRAEWMWVELTSVEDGGAKLKGILKNQPGCFAIDLEYGDEVEFSNRDVFAPRMED